MSGRYQVKGLFRIYTQGLRVISGLMGQEIRVIILVIRGAVA